MTQAFSCGRWRALIGSGVLAVLCTAAQADQIFPASDLVCAKTSNLALIRFGFSDNGDKPDYAGLPPQIDGGLSHAPGSGRTDCQLKNGTAIRLRTGEEQAFAYGMGGGDPPAFFSLWIDKRRVFSRRPWKPGYEESFGNHTMLVGLVIRSDKLTFCTRDYDADDGPVQCKDEAFSLFRHKVDKQEYPDRPAHSLSAGRILVEATSPNRAFCQARIDDNLVGNLDQLTKLGAVVLSQTENPAEGLAADPVPGDFTNLSGLRAFLIDGTNHYFDGDIVVIAPRRATAREVSALFPAGDIDQEAAQRPSQGWTIISGGRTGLYPNVSARYVHFAAQKINGELYFLATPTNVNKRPAAVLLKPEEAGGFRNVCVFDEAQLHF